MEYFQNVVGDFLRAKRTLFLNSEFFLPLHAGELAPKKGTSWVVDYLAIDFELKTVFLCEVTYSQTLSTLLKRLSAWSDQWSLVCEALRRDAKLPAEYPIQPWVFVPDKEKFWKKYNALNLSPSFMPPPKVTLLGDTVPWKYRTFDRKDIEEGGTQSKPEVEM